MNSKEKRLERLEALTPSAAPSEPDFTSMTLEELTAWREENMTEEERRTWENMPIDKLEALANEHR